jgi:hypothetical protein
VVGYIIVKSISSQWRLKKERETYVAGKWVDESERKGRTDRHFYSKAGKRASFFYKPLRLRPLVLLREILQKCNVRMVELVA